MSTDEDAAARAAVAKMEADRRELHTRICEVLGVSKTTDWEELMVMVEELAQRGTR